VLLSGPVVRDRVRWSDLDVMGIVYFGRYLRFMESAEAEFFRTQGFTYDRLAEEFGIWLARVHLAIDYRTPARLDDEVVCAAQLAKLGGSSLRFAFPIDRADGLRLADGVLVLAALDRVTMRPTRLPAPLREMLQRSSAASTP
jgi:YbgC/YbaW family acyl-CoA thioester hydrolase